MIERPAVSVLRVLAVTYGKYAQVRVRNFLASHLNRAVFECLLVRRRAGVLTLFFEDGI